MKHPWARYISVMFLLCAGCALSHPLSHPRAESVPAALAPGSWRFAVSGDSRNCGDVVMPAIAQDAIRQGALFYWHLGDFRKMNGLDEDMAQAYHGTLDLADYQRDAWGDFLTNQIAPFDPMPVYLGIGNHELYRGPDVAASRRDFLMQFAYWLDAPALRAQRILDDGSAGVPRGYFHWKQGGVDFINLDNADVDGFDDAQLTWLERVLTVDVSDPVVHAAVVGMHRALPNSLACAHSMNGDKDRENQNSLASGRRAYNDLLKWHTDSGKPLYVLASHSHFFMEGTFDTPYWKRRGALPGWIVGTAGARRYPLPENLPPGMQAQTFVYGYLVATVTDAGVQFDFRELTEQDIPKAVVDRFGINLVHECFSGNRDIGKPAPPPDSCLEQ